MGKRSRGAAVGAVAVTTFGVGCSFLFNADGLSQGSNDGAIPIADGSPTESGNGSPGCVVTGPETCGPVITGENGVGKILVEGSRLAWMRGDVVRACQLSACEATAVTVVDSEGADIAVDSDGLFLGAVQSGGAGHIYRLSFDGGAPTEIGVGENITTVTTDVNGTLLATFRRLLSCPGRYNCGEFDGWPLIAPSAEAPFMAIAGTPTLVFWVTRGSLRSCPRTGCSGGTANVESTGLTDPRALTVDSKGVTFTDHGAGRVLRCPLAGCGSAPTVLAAQTPTAAPLGVASDGTRVVWANEGDGTVVECSVDGCDKPRVIAYVAAPRYIALSNNTVFVSASGSDTIYRIDR